MGVLGEGDVDDFEVEVKLVLDFERSRRQIHRPVVYEVGGGQRIVADATLENGQVIGDLRPVLAITVPNYYLP